MIRLALMTSVGLLALATLAPAAEAPSAMPKANGQPAASAVPAVKPVEAAPLVLGSVVTTSGSTCCDGPKCGAHGKRFLEWLTYRPQKDCCKIPIGSCSPPVYTFFLDCCPGDAVSHAKPKKERGPLFQWEFPVLSSMWERWGVGCCK